MRALSSWVPSGSLIEPDKGSSCLPICLLSREDLLSLSFWHGVVKYELESRGQTLFSEATGPCSWMAPLSIHCNTFLFFSYQSKTGQVFAYGVQSHSDKGYNATCLDPKSRWEDIEDAEKEAMKLIRKENKSVPRSKKRRKMKHQWKLSLALL